ncbi:hypothetical protein LZ32DRAFT_614196 [Colletotrichum eremochloae]|nr:hypothetical protein LZ32DRAFT_614196 [Colletotrichum eremochloae]
MLSYSLTTYFLLIEALYKYNLSKSKDIVITNYKSLPKNTKLIRYYSLKLITTYTKNNYIYIVTIKKFNLILTFKYLSIVKVRNTKLLIIILIKKEKYKKNNKTINKTKVKGTKDIKTKEYFRYSLAKVIKLNRNRKSTLSFTNVIVILSFKSSRLLIFRIRSKVTRYKVFNNVYLTNLILLAKVTYFIKIFKKLRNKKVTRYKVFNNISSIEYSSKLLLSLLNRISTSFSKPISNNTSIKSFIKY